MVLKVFVEIYLHLFFFFKKFKYFSTVYYTSRIIHIHLDFSRKSGPTENSGLYFQPNQFDIERALSNRGTIF